jgi:hypothetical protein
MLWGALTNGSCASSAVVNRASDRRVITVISGRPTAPAAAGYDRRGDIAEHTASSVNSVLCVDRMAALAGIVWNPMLLIAFYATANYSTQ